MPDMVSPFGGLRRFGTGVPRSCLVCLVKD